jgi:hypothetical protein
MVVLVGLYERLYEGALTAGGFTFSVCVNVLEI